jgi:uncharacterized protein YijF (DUF1287 family)
MRRRGAQPADVPAAGERVRAGDQVQWIVEGGTMRVGVFVRGIPAGEVPALAAGVGKQRRAFRARAARMPRVLVRDFVTGFITRRWSRVWKS